MLDSGLAYANAQLGKPVTDPVHPVPSEERQGPSNGLVQRFRGDPDDVLLPGEIPAGHLAGAERHGRNFARQIDPSVDQ